MQWKMLPQLRDMKLYLYPRLLFKFQLPYDIQAISFKSNIKKEKYHAVSIYRPPSLNNQYLPYKLFDLLDFYSSKYDSKVVFGDLILKRL